MPDVTMNVSFVIRFCNVTALLFFCISLPSLAIQNLNLEQERGYIFNFLSLLKVVYFTDLLSLHRVNKCRSTVPLVESKARANSPVVYDRISCGQHSFTSSLACI
jgi:hypothetical protein